MLLNATTDQQGVYRITGDVRPGLYLEGMPADVRPAARGIALALGGVLALGGLADETLFLGSLTMRNAIAGLVPNYATADRYDVA